MAIKRTYLDYNASAPLLAEAKAAMLATLALEGNPSSVHAEGRRLRGVIEAARDQVATLVGARAADIVFTSGATEANVTVLSRGWDTIFVSGIEHESVLAPVKACGARVIVLPVDRSGVVDVAAFKAAIAREREPFGRAVVAVQMANNETGAIQPVADIAALAREHTIVCHTDAVQAAGRLPIDMDALGVDTMAISAHKIGGPKGVGALVVRQGVAIPAFMCGGGQERRRRAGTENVAGLAGFGAAAVAAVRGISGFAHIAALRDELERGVLQLSPRAVIFSSGAARIGNTTCVGVAGKPAEIALIKLDVAGFAVSAGSACSSGKVGASHVLAAMGADADAAGGAIRISLGPTTTAGDIAAFLDAWSDIFRASAGASRQVVVQGAISGQPQPGLPALGE